MTEIFNTTLLIAATPQLTVIKMEKNDIVYIDYELWIKEDDQLFETTKEELARDKDIYEPSDKYGPKAIILGRGQVFPGFEESIMGADTDKDYEVEISPEDAFGKRDAGLVQLIPMSRIIRMGITPDIGKEVELDGRKGVITFVSASRVRIDFNHPLAGKTLLYKYRVTKKIDSDKEKMKAIVDSYYGKGDEFKFQSGKTLKITLPDICKYDHHWHEVKYAIVADLREIIAPEKIVFIEEYTGKKKEKKKSEKKEDKSSEKEVSSEDKSEETVKEDESSEKKD